MNESDWLRHLLPLPREISIPGAVACRPDAVRVVAAADPDEVMTEAVARLERILDPCGASPAVTIALGLVGHVPAAGADERLGSLPHAGQAYRISCPSRSRIVVAGVTSAGVLYGALTLAQLLAAGRRGDALGVPLAEVVDWPEFDERGLWNFPDPAAWIPWMAEMKLNYGKRADTALEPVTRRAPGRAVIDAGLHERARRLAFRYVPYIVHLNFLHDVGLFRAYPSWPARATALGPGPGHRRGAHLRALAGATWSVAHGFAHADLESVDQQRSLAAAVDELDRVGEDNVHAIRAWRSHLGPEPWHHRVTDAIDATRDTVRRIGAHIRDRCLY